MDRFKAEGIPLAVGVLDMDWYAAIVTYGERHDPCKADVVGTWYIFRPSMEPAGQATRVSLRSCGML